MESVEDMTEETSSEEIVKKTENRGVNVTSDCFSVVETAADKVSLVDTKQDVQAVIELMGPNTPRFNYNTSSEADNEESIFSSVSGLSSILHFKKMKKHSELMDTSEMTEKSVALRTPPPSKIDSHHHQENISFACPHCRVYSMPPPSRQAPPPPPPPPVCVNPNCVCVHSMGYIQQMPINFDNINCRSEKENYFTKLFRRKRKEENDGKELYQVNLVHTRDERSHSPPKKLVFDLVDGVPRPEVNTIGINTINSGLAVVDNKKSLDINQAREDPSSEVQFCNQMIPKVVSNNKNKPVPRSTNYYPSDTTKVDVYYFDHGNYSYFRTTDSPPLIVTEILAEKTENYTTKFWAQFFGTVHIGFAFFTSFFLQLFRFLLYGLVRPLTVGVLQLGSDYFFKPFLTVLFNGLIQPPLTFFYNVALSIKDLCDPVAEGVGYFFREIANVFRAIRIIEVKNGTQCNNCEVQKKKTSKNFPSEQSCSRCIISSQ